MSLIVAISAALAAAGLALLAGLARAAALLTRPDAVDAPDEEICEPDCRCTWDGIDDEPDSPMAPWEDL